MYTPSAFRESDHERVTQFISDNRFATLISINQGQPFVSHVPLIYEGQQQNSGQLIGHLARANPQWQHAEGNVVTAVFTGPHAYISPSWYETPESVPTWNYTAVHMSGTFRIICDDDQLRSAVENLVSTMEADRLPSWTMNTASPKFVDRLLTQIVGFQIEIDYVETKFKLSQNHSQVRQQNVIDHLSASHQQFDRDIAELMKHNLK